MEKSIHRPQKSRWQLEKALKFPAFEGICEDQKCQRKLGIVQIFKKGIERLNQTGEGIEKGSEMKIGGGKNGIESVKGERRDDREIEERYKEKKKKFGGNVFGEVCEKDGNLEKT
jgi:hypothetical protein